MNGVLSILRRELAGLFLSPLAWILLCIGLFLVGWDFTTAIQGMRGDVVAGMTHAAGGGPMYWGVMIFLHIQSIIIVFGGTISVTLLAFPMADLKPVLKVMLVAAMRKAATPIEDTKKPSPCSPTRKTSFASPGIRA